MSKKTTKIWPLESLNFGRDDAELDIADGLLRRGFLKTVAFNEAANGRKNLIIGRKGSGKSAICVRLLEASDPRNSASLITPDDATGEEIRRFELQGLNDHTAKSLVWRYVFSVQLARYLVNHAEAVHDGAAPSSLKRVRRFLRDNGELDNERLYERFVRGVSGLHGSISLEAFGVKAGAEVKGAAEGAKASRKLDVIEQEISSAGRELGCHQQHSPLLIMVDQLEQVWSNDVDSDTMIIGLLLAGKQFTATYAGLARSVLFLRSDIYDALHFGDGDKFHGSELRIEWDDQRLSDLALLRAQATLGSDLTWDDFWHGVLPSKIKGEDARSYVLSRTLPRPRDVIQLLNAMRDTAYERGHTRILEEDAISATLRFSQWKLQDLAKEYLVTYPFLDRLLLMFQNTGFLVTRASVRKNFAPIRDILHRLYPSYADSLEPDGIVDILHAVGFLGVKRGGGVEYSGGHHLALQPYENVFEVHPCFRLALNAEREAKFEDIVLRSAQGVQGVQIASSNVQFNAFSSEGRTFIRPGRESGTLEEITRSCERILTRVGRLQLPNGLRREVRDAILRLDSEAHKAYQSSVIGGGSNVARELAFRAADYLDDLTRQLADSGLTDAGDIEAIQRLLEEEARRLRIYLRGFRAT